MANAPSITTAARNAAADAVVDLLDAGDTAAQLRIYSGTAPATVNDALSGNTLLAQLTMSDPEFGSAAAGEATAAAITQDSSADATGTAARRFKRAPQSASHPSRTPSQARRGRLDVAVLSNADRTGVWADFMRRLSDVRSPLGLTKTQLSAAVDGIDDWVDSAATAVPATSFNAAIPQPARSVLTASQKAWLLALVVLRRYEVTP
jgi:hypothetical protein